MLNWWLGRPDGAERVAGADPDIDAPETPAPVFAARALKSAFFGTPGLPQDDTLYGLEKEDDLTTGRDNRLPHYLSASPTKPPGILMTPGAAATRRKTVSFGSDVDDNEGKDRPQKIVGRAPTPGKALTSWIAQPEELSQPIRKTSLLKTLEDSRGSDSASKKRNQFSTTPSTLPNFTLAKEKNVKTQNDAKELKNPRSKGVQPAKESMSGVDSDADITVDINDPRSQSGKFWKSEFQKYHDEAQTQMKKLVGYKQLAKSYAKKKDAEALDLAEKLKEEQAKVATMENNITELMSQIAADGKSKGDSSPALMRELARQTALAFQYRVQVEEFRKAMEGDGSLAAAVPKTELRNAKNEPRDTTSIQNELEQALQALAAADRTVSKLQAENNKLSQDLLHSDLRFETHTESWEKRLKLVEGQRQKKEDRLKALQKDYDHMKQTAKSSRRDAEQLLRKRHDQVVELKKRIASLKGEYSTTTDLEQALHIKSIEYDTMVDAYEKEIAKLRELVRGSTYDEVTAESGYDLFRTRSHPTEKSHAFTSNIPVLSHSIARPSKTVASSKSTNFEAPTELTQRSSHAALSEITNLASTEQYAFQKSKKVDYTPVANRYADLSLDSPNVNLQAEDLSLPLLRTRTSRERCLDSPRPKIYNIPSSPPKATVSRSRAVDLLKSNNERGVPRLTTIALSRRSSPSKCALPPDRVAAAKARLALKNAEKRRAQGLGANSIR
ncbi:putative urease accessory protein [Botrytis cinerea BcDW1]|uniref:Putative urease accessory protein n=1 Tax=Botryotinia fuckeliana (strain BcDW1) TaxID=1290391 RepID=M7UIR6_BOTF1|nr:putative urease accessory protein [Botrytis cinerea BcDW1]